MSLRLRLDDRTQFPFDGDISALGDAKQLGLLITFLWLVGVPASAQTPTGSQAPDEAASAPEGSVAPSALKWDVSQRSRYATLRNQFRPGLSGDDQALVFRTTFRVEVPVGPTNVVAEFQDARAYLTDDQSNVSTALVNAIDLLQAHVRFGDRTATRAFVPKVQAGRFSMELGSGRLVAQEAYRDVTRTFTGALLQWRHVGQSAITAFAVLPVLTLPDDRVALLDNHVQRDREHLNSRFWGVLFERPTFWLGMHGEAYVFRLDEHDVAGKRETRDRAIWTGGGRLFRAAARRKYDVDVEAAGQMGRAHASSAPTDQRALDVAAWYLHGSTGFTWSPSWVPRLGVEYDYGSGDTSPVDGKWNRFDSLFGNRRVDLGPTSIYGALGRENIDTVGIRMSAAPTSRLDAFAAYRWVGLAAAADAFASTGLRDSSGRAGRDGGRQLDVRARVWLVPRLVRVEAGVTHLLAGRFMRDAPNAMHQGNTTFLYSDITYSVGSRQK